MKFGEGPKGPSTQSAAVQTDPVQWMQELDEGSQDDPLTAHDGEDDIACLTGQQTNDPGKGPAQWIHSHTRTSTVYNAQIISGNML